MAGNVSFVTAAAQASPDPAFFLAFCAAERRSL
jgi:hypothetical protein